MEGILYKLKYIPFFVFIILFLQGCEDSLNKKSSREQEETTLIEDIEKEEEAMTTVYDKAKWHYEGDFPSNLSEKQAFVHTGMYLGWIIEENLYSKEFEEEAAQDIIKFKQKNMTGTEIYMEWDGVFASDMLNAEGRAFTKDYFDFDKGTYLDDYEAIFPHIKSLYEVEDTWNNYEAINTKINERFDTWKHTNEENKGDKLFTVDSYIGSLKKTLEQNEDKLINNIEKVHTFHYYKGIDLLDFEIFIQPFDLSIMMFSMDNEANEVFYEGNDRAIFSGSYELLEGFEYYELADEHSDEFWDFYEQNEEEISAAEKELISNWFMSCWNKAGDNGIKLPVYLDFHDDIESFDLKKKKWIDSEDKWSDENSN